MKICRGYWSLVKIWH